MQAFLRFLLMAIDILLAIDFLIRFFGPLMSFLHAILQLSCHQAFYLLRYIKSLIFIGILVTGLIAILGVVFFWQWLAPDFYGVLLGRWVSPHGYGR